MFRSVLVKSVCRTRFPLYKKPCSINAAGWSRALSKLENGTDFSLMEAEKELFAMRRRIGVFYSKGHYNDAKMESEALIEKIKDIMGTSNSIYASGMWSDIVSCLSLLTLVSFLT
jgi:hypothetical protein